MRHIAKVLAPLASAAAIAGLAAFAGPAQAQPTAGRPAPAGLYAPSALVLSVGVGEEASEATVTRAVVLSCTPSARGTHPAPRRACSNLRAANAEFDQMLLNDRDRMCSVEWEPVVVMAEGVWQGKRISWQQTFGNACKMDAALTGSPVFSF